MDYQEKIMLALEGGYNFKSLQKCSEAVIRILHGEQFPIKDLRDKYKKNEVRYNLIPNYIAIKTVNECLPILSEYWPVLL